MEKSGSTFVRDSQLLSFAELSCELPKVPVIINGDVDKSPGKPTGGFYIQLSNNRKSYSKNRTLFIVYDSKCMECTKGIGDEKRTCKWKVKNDIHHTKDIDNFIK